MVKDVGSKAVYSLDEVFARHSLLGEQVFFEPALLGWTRTLEAHTQEIRRELERLLEDEQALPAFHEISPDQKSITSDQGWKTFFLVGFRRRSAVAGRMCPRTVQLLEGIPGLVTAFFSILSPGKVIPEHTGPYKGLLRYHLALRVPKEAERCTITVAGQTRHWVEGQSLLFDDRYPHQVHNATGESRAVLFVDVYRPLPAHLELLNRGVVELVARSPYVQDGVARQRAWESRVGQALAARYSNGGQGLEGPSTGAQP